MEQKQNDWLATLFFQPDKTPQDLFNAGITTDNSELKDIDFYKKIPEIQQAFSDDSGKFDDQKFTKYYNEALQLYNWADQQQFTNTLVENHTYDSMDIFAPKKSKVRDTSPVIIDFPNPERRAKGLTNFFETSDATRSAREVAESQLVVDSVTGEELDWTPNDKGGIFSNLIRPTLVLATWDEDGYHDVDGRQVMHHKGEYKFNKYGDPYYETLGGRSAAGKDVLAWSDTLTVDGSKWNKYDFFDSDDLDKSMTGTIAKSVVKVAPLFIPGIGGWYAGLGAAMELGKLLPTLYKSITGIASGDISDRSDTKTANEIEGFFRRFDNSMSDHGRESFFRFEQLMDVAASSFNQLKQQRLIGNLPFKMTKAGQPSQKMINFGRNISWAYMAGTSSTDAYNMFKEAGASDRVAGLGMFAVTGAMFKLMNSDYFRDFWYEGTYLGNSQFRKALKNAAEQESKAEFTKEVIKNAEKETAKGAKKAAQWVIKQKDKLYEKLSKMKPTDIMYGAANEGLEEVMEEVSTDAVKGLFSGMNALGLVDNDRKLDFGITPEDMFSRYLTSAIGGAIGGAMFSLSNKFDKSFKESDELIKLGGDGFKEIVYYARQGKMEQLRQELDRLRKKGALGSTNLSAFDFTVNKDGSYTYKASKGEGDSHNDVIYKRLLDYLNRIDSIVKEEGMNFPDEMLQAMSSRFLDENPEWDKEDAEQAAKNWYKQVNQESNDSVLWELGIGTQALEDWQNLTEEIVKTRAELESMITPAEDESKTPKDIDAKIEAAKNDKNYQEASKKLADLRKQRDSLINGSKTDWYFTQLQFALNPKLRNYIIKGVGIHEYTKLKHDKNYDDLSDDEKKIVDDEYAVFSKDKEKAAVLDAHKMFYNLQESTKNDIKTIFDKFNYDTKILENETEYTAFLDTQRKIIAEKQQELDEILKNLKKDEELPDEAKKLQVEINKQKRILGSYEAMRYGAFRQKLTEAGEKLLHRPTGGDLNLELENYAESYLNFLDHLVKNHLYTDLVDSDLSQLFTYYLNSINPEGNPGQSIQKLAEDKITNLLVEHYGTSDIDDGDISTFVNLASRIATALNNSDIDEILKVMDEAKSIDSGFLSEMAQNDDTTPDKWLAEIFPNIGSKSLIDFVKEVKEKKSKLRTSPIYDLLEKVAKLSGLDDDLIQLITKEQQNLLNSVNVRDFLIKDKNVLDKIQKAIQLIGVTQALLKSTPEGGYNDKANPARKEAKKDNLPVFKDTEKLANMMASLERLKGQLEVLSNIAERNQAQKVRVNKDIEMIMRPKFLNATIKDSLFQSKFEKAFGVDLKKLVEDANIPSEVTDENYVEFVEKLTKLESSIYKAIKEKGLSNEELANKIISLFDPVEVAKMTPSEFVKDKEKKLTEYDKLIYVANILGYDALEFAGRMKAQVASFEAAPFYAQEYAIRCGFTSIVNPDLFNNIIRNIKTEVAKSKDKYLATRSELYNFLIIYGGAGAGKTALVDRYIAEMIKGEAGIITCAPETEQVEKLNKSIDHKGKYYTKGDLLRQITGKSVFTDADLVEIMDGSEGVSTKLRPDMVISHENIFGDSKIKVLFIDEISLFNRPELEAISQWALENDVQVVASGDYMQNPASCLYKGKYDKSGVEDTIAIKTPDLEASIRSAVVAKADNYNELRNTLRVIHNYRMSNPEFGYDQIDAFAVKHLEANPITLKYYESEAVAGKDEDFGGTKFIDDDTTVVDNYIKKLSRLSDDVCIITDAAHISKYSAYKGVKVRTFNTIQGSEFDYIIVDQHAMKKGMLDRLTDIYTITQRSKLGSIFVQPKPVWLNNKEDKHSNAFIGLTPDQISEFKSWKTSGYSWIGDLTFTSIEELRDEDASILPKSEDVDDEAGEPEVKPTSEEDSSTEGAVEFKDERDDASETEETSDGAEEDLDEDDSTDDSEPATAEEDDSSEETGDDDTTDDSGTETPSMTPPKFVPPTPTPSPTVSVTEKPTTVPPKPIAPVKTKRVETEGTEITENYQLLNSVLQYSLSNPNSNPVCQLSDIPFKKSGETAWPTKYFLYIMRMYFLRGYYKTNFGKAQLPRLIGQYLNYNVYKALSAQYSEALPNSDWKFIWKQINNPEAPGKKCSILCAQAEVVLKQKFSEETSKSLISIPIFATENLIPDGTEYTGEFVCYKSMKAISSKDKTKAFSITKASSHIKVPVFPVGKPMVLAVTQKNYNAFSPEYAKKIGLGKDVSITNNVYMDGKTFQCFTDDPFITEVPEQWFEIGYDADNKITSLNKQYTNDNHIIQVGASGSVKFSELLRLLASNWKSILNGNAKKTGLTQYLTGARAGSLVGWLYKLRPEYRDSILNSIWPDTTTKQFIGADIIKIYAKNSDGKINVIYEGTTKDFKNAKENTKQQLDEICKTDAQIFFMPEFVDTNADPRITENQYHITSFGDRLLMQVLHNLKLNNKITVSQDAQLIEDFDSKYVHGIYVRDAVEDPNSPLKPDTNPYYFNIKGLTANKDVQIVGLETLEVSQYKIKLASDTAVEESKKSEKTNDDFKKAGIKAEVKNAQEIPSAVQKANEEQKRSTTTGVVTEVVNTGKGVATKTNVDYKQLFQNLMKKQGFEINQDQIISHVDNFLNYQMFSVSLGDEIAYFVLSNNSGNYMIKRIPEVVGRSWEGAIIQWTSNGPKLSANSNSYLVSILSGLDVKPENAIAFYNEVAKNEKFQKLKDRVTEFLFSKLETHEC